MPFDNELYKSLLDESKLCREKVSSIWLQKFTMLGAIIVFAATRAEATSKNPDLIAAAILSLPLIAILLDVKSAEFGIHARIIDDFIIRNYHEPSVLSDWERTKWGDIDNADRTLVRYRSASTVAVTVIPTCIIACLAVLAARPFLGATAYRGLHAASIGFCSIYVILALILWITVMFRRTASTAKKASR
jgi:hypothetical protein